jgi:hypothetical protein
MLAQSNSALQIPKGPEQFLLRQHALREMHNLNIRGSALRFGAWNFSGAWSLGFEASQASYSTENSEEPHSCHAVLY